MARKLNRNAAEAYSKNFSAKVVEDFYANRQAATGQDILEFTPVQQINLLLIQRLYVRWQEDALRLRSPYFNYEHPQVKEALQHFMNTLSRHIQLEREALQPLLEEAVLDSLRLLLQPMAYFAELMQRYPQPDTLQNSLRYLRWQEPITTALNEQLDQKAITDPDFMLTLLDAGIKSGNLELDPIDEHILAYEQILPMPLELVDEPDKESGPSLPKEEEGGDFFSAITRSAPKPGRPTQRVELAPQNEAPKATQAQPLFVKNEAPQHAPAPTPLPEPIAVPTPAEAPSAARAYTAPQPAPAPPVEQKSSSAASHRGEASPARRQEEEAKTLNTRFERSEKKPLHEKFEQKEARPPKIQKPRSASIRNYITLNQRFMFVKELFGGDGGAFNAALDALDACQDSAEARQWVATHMAEKRQWQEHPEVAEEFEGVLEHRFRN
jgi:hypothetical protein